MRLEKVDLNLFIVFEAIYRERSVTRVAALLNLTQPAVSNALSRLRQTFDDPLFVRSPEGMTPTPVAEGVINDVRKALSLLGRSVGSGARFDPLSAEKVFRLGMNDLAGYLLLPELRQRLKQQAPKVSISSYYVDRQTASENLKSGGLDLLLDSPQVNAKEFEQVSLGQLPYVVAMRQGHALAGKAMTLEDYLASEHIHVSSRRRGRGQVDVGLHTIGCQRQIMMRVQNYMVAARVAATTDLIWTAPRVLVEDTLLSYTELPFAVDPLWWNLYWHKSADDDPANQWIRSVIRDAALDVLSSQ